MIESGPTSDRSSDYARVNVNSPQRRTRSCRRWSCSSISGETSVRGRVDSRPGAPPPRAPAYGATGATVGAAAAAQAGSEGGAATRSAPRDDPRVAGRRPERAAQAAPHREAGLAAPRGRARGERRRVDGASLRRPRAPRARVRQGDGDDPPAASAGRGGGGRLRRGQRLARRGADRALDVRHAALPLGARRPRLLPGRGPGGVPRGTYGRPWAPRRGAAARPLRQSQGGRDARARRTRPHRERPLHRAALALRLRRVLLRARHRGRARERRRGRARSAASAGATSCRSRASRAWPS